MGIKINDGCQRFMRAIRHLTLADKSAGDLWRIKPPKDFVNLFPGHDTQLKLPCQMINGRYSNVLNNLTPNPS